MLSPLLRTLVEQMFDAAWTSFAAGLPRSSTPTTDAMSRQTCWYTVLSWHEPAHNPRYTRPIAQETYALSGIHGLDSNRRCPPAIADLATG